MIRTIESGNETYHAKQHTETGMNRERMLWHGPNGHSGIKRTEPSNARFPVTMENGVVDVALHSFPVSLSVEWNSSREGKACIRGIGTLNLGHRLAHAKIPANVGCVLDEIKLQ
jgi:hypothetical protein